MLRRTPRWMLLGWLACLALPAACASLGDGVAGRWSGTVDGQGGQLQLTLVVQAEQVTGLAERTSGPMGPRRAVVSGHWRGQRLQLTLRETDGTVLHVDVRRTSAERLDGQLTWPDKGQQALTLVRP